MSKKKYLIDERNEWSGEKFGYVVCLTDDEYRSFKARLKMLSNFKKMDALGRWEDDGINAEDLTIKPFDLTDKEVELINEYSSNRHSKRIRFFEFSKPQPIEKFQLFKYSGSVFHDLGLIEDIER